MSKGTTIKDALKLWEAKTNEVATESKVIKLYMQLPPIEKCDASLSTLQCCEHLALSTNAIDKISNLNGLVALRILSLGRNNIKKLDGLEPVAETLEELWLSYNLVERMKGITVLKRLKVLYMSNNKVKDWNEFEKLTELPVLETLLFTGNPLEIKQSEDGSWRDEACRRLQQLKRLDGIPIVSKDEDDV